LARLHALSFRLWHLVLDRLDGVKGAMEQHIEITLALKAQDGPRAEALIREHVSEFQQGIKSVL
jgi:DNA-binding GntR family transcriptional regulator